MADTNLPSAAPQGGMLAPLTNGGNAAKLRGFMAQPAIRKSLPAALGIGALAATAMLYMALADGPQRLLYSDLSDSERAGVVATLDTGGISYQIDPGTGAVSVAEDDIYRARMLVASDGSLATPETTSQMLDAMPMGASRTMEGERLRNVRERELMQTIMEIDGVENVRVHLAQPEKSVFVRDDVAPTASVMLRLARGRQISESQVQAILNLVAASVPGLTPDGVRVVDQQGRLLSSRESLGASEMFDLQSQYEEKLRAQISALLTPMLGEGNFSSQIQVQLDMQEVTSARETYEKEGALRSENQSESRSMAAQGATGVPGATANTPPPPTEVREGAPQGTPAEAGQAAPAIPTNDESSAQRRYELDREVAVSSTAPGSVRRISVAVAVSAEALEKIKPATEEKLQQLVASAVGANLQRGDEVTVMASAFEIAEEQVTPFYETKWFGMVLRNGVALLAVLLALLFGVRPLLKAIRKDPPAEDTTTQDASDELPPPSQLNDGPGAFALQNREGGQDSALLREQVNLAQKLANEQPDRAVAALRKMLAAPAPAAAGDSQ